MSRPKFKPQERRAAAPASHEETARKALAAGRFREAVEACKELLKLERRAEWVEALATAYAGRAAELRAKGMIPEALTIWRNRANACGKPLAEPQYLECLCLAGAGSEAFRLVATVENPTARAALEAQLPALALRLPTEVLSQLPDDDLLRRHHASAVAALAACCAGDTAALDNALREIPFRSPYRDLRPVLKALDSVRTEPAQVGVLLARVGPDSAFARLAALVRMAALPDDEWLPALAEVDPAGQELLLELKGCPPPQRPLLCQLARLGPTPAPEQVIALLLRSGRPLTADIEALCRHLLPHATDQIREVSTYFNQLPRFEHLRLSALNAEITDRSGNYAIRIWQTALKALGTSGEDAKNAAMIWQHLAFAGNAHAVRERATGPAIGWLEKSLELDSDNPTARLQLIRLYLKAGEVKLARKHLDPALAAAPGDPKTLLLAVELAVASDSHKKALGFARQLLELDPINPQVRGLIGRAGLAQARKQIRARRSDLALNEIEQAWPWLTDPESRRVAGVLRALCASATAAAGALHEAVADFAGPLSAGLCLALEAQRSKNDIRSVFGSAGLRLDAQPDAADLADFVRALDAVADKEQKIIARALDYLGPLIERAAAHPLPQDARIAACEALLRREQFTALKVYARAGLMHAPQHPLFTYFAVMARSRGNGWNVIERDHLRLEEAHTKAMEQGDQRTALRIAQLLQQTDWDDDDEDPDSDQGNLDLTGGLDPTDLRTMARMLIETEGSDVFLSLMRRTVGAARFESLKKATGHDEQRLIDLLIDEMVASGQSSGLVLAEHGAASRPNTKD